MNEKMDHKQASFSFFLILLLQNSPSPLKIIYFPQFSEQSVKNIHNFWGKNYFQKGRGGDGFFEKIYTPVSLDFSPKSLM